MSVRSVFRRFWRVRHAVDRFAAVLFILILLALYILCYPNRPSGTPYGVGLLLLLLLFNCFDRIATEFKWPVWLAVAIYLLTWCLAAFGLFYICYWSYVLCATSPVLKVMIFS